MGEEEKPEKWILRLYVAGQSYRCREALSNLKRICEIHLEGRYEIEVIDILARPTLAAEEQILAVPTLERQLPEPVRRLIGDLSNEIKVLIGLDIRGKE